MFTTKADARVIDHGVVWCPERQRDVDIEECFACPRFQGLDTNEAGWKMLRCRPPSVRTIWTGMPIS